MRTKVKNYDQQAKMLVSCSDISKATIGLWSQYDEYKEQGHECLAEETYQLIKKFGNALEEKGFWQCG